MQLLYHSVCLEHDTGEHPENNRRMLALAEHFGLSEGPLVDGSPYLELIHPPEYIEMIRRVSAEGGAIDEDTRLSPGSYRAAVHAVGLTVEAARRGDFALVRPPGHHAHPGMASGFCLFNNVAIAAQHLVSQGKRVAIIDIDGHLGDGTEVAFYDTDEVLFWSLHQFPAFPYGGLADQIGDGQGRGYTINTPLPPGSADDIFLDALDHFLPIVEKFAPDVVAISAGFDTHEYDPILSLNCSYNAYYQTGKRLRERFPQVFAVLEGGYNVELLPRCVESFLAGINGEPMPYPVGMTQSGLRVWETYEINVYATLAYLRPYWG